jgi:hypothetical protein
MTRKLSTLALLAAALLCGALEASANGNFGWRATVTVPQGVSPDDAHLVFANTGGIGKAYSLDTTLVSISTSNGNTVDLAFHIKQVAGRVFQFNFETVAGNPAVVFSSGTWTNGGNVVGAISPADVSLIQIAVTAVTPGIGTTGLALLSLLTLGSGIYILRRRRAATV